MGFGKSLENTTTKKESQEKKTLGKQKNQQREGVFSVAKKELQKELTKQYGVEQGQEIFEQIGKNKLEELQINNPEIFILPVKKILGILFDEMKLEKQNDITEKQNDITEKQDDITEKQDDITEKQDDITEKQNDITKNNKDITKNNKDIIENNKDNKDIFLKRKTSSQWNKIQQLDSSKFKQSVNSLEVNFALKEYRKRNDITDINDSAYFTVEEFYQLGAHWLQIQNKIQSGENITAEEQSFAKNFSDLSESLGIELSVLSQNGHTETFERSSTISLKNIARDPSELLKTNKSLKKFMQEYDKDFPKIKFKENPKKMLKFFAREMKHELNDAQKKYIQTIYDGMDNDGVIDTTKLKENNFNSETIYSDLEKILLATKDKLQNQTQSVLKTSVMKNCFSALNTYFDTTPSSTLNFSQDFSCEKSEGIFFDGNIMKMDGEIQGKKICITYDLKVGMVSFNSFISYNSQDNAYEISGESQQITKLKVPKKSDLYAVITKLDLDEVVDETKNIERYTKKLENILDKKIQPQFKHNELNKYYIEKNISRELAQQNILKNIQRFIAPDMQNEGKKFTINSLSPRKKEFFDVLFKTTEQQNNPDLTRKLQNLFDTLLSVCLDNTKIRNGKSPDVVLNSLFSIDARKSNPDRMYDFLLMMKKGTGLDARINIEELTKTIKLLDQGKDLEQIFGTKDFYKNIKESSIDDELDNLLDQDLSGNFD